MSARLTSEGAPVSGVPVTFELAGEEWSASVQANTDADGRATAVLGLEGPPGPYQLTARFAENETYEGSVDVAPFVIEREDTALSLSVTGKGSKTELEALLRNRDDGSGVAGRTITFYADGAEIGTAETNGSGLAVLSPPPRYRGGHRDYEARFDGDRFYLGSVGRTSTWLH